MAAIDDLVSWPDALQKARYTHFLDTAAIISDTAAEKKQDMAEVGITMAAWEYRHKRYGEEERVARERAKELGTPSEKSLL